MKKNYIIPYEERFTQINGGVIAKRSLMCADNVGLIVGHKADYTPTEKDVRRNLIGIKTNTILVQADSLQEALQEFLNYPECRTGVKHKAWSLASSERNPVIEYSGCECMRLLNSGVACAKYDEPRNGGYMICILDGLDDPP